jgi:hypothetical protein
MKKLIIYTLTGLILMGLFSFLSKSKSNPPKSILGMILLEEANSMQIDKVVAELKNKWNLSVNDEEADKETSILVIDNYQIAIANIPMPIPGDEIETTAEYNYFWKDGTEEATKHKGHIILSIMDAGKNPVMENILFNKVAASILNNSKSLGIYIGERTLLLKKEFYLENTEMMSEQYLPLYNWIYFGLRQEDGKQSMYTFGLADFNKPEMEIIDSDYSFNELSEMMFDMVHYVIAYDVTLKDGETIGTSATQKLEISYSKGKFLEGKTLKIKY